MEILSNTCGVVSTVVSTKKACHCRIERGFRQDVLAAIKSLKVPNIRWPGGNFVSAYHWMDGIGPKDERPRKMELAWNTVESNRFGTDEFIQFCREVGAAPLHLRQYGKRHNGRGTALGRILQRSRGHLLRQPPSEKWARRTVPCEILGIGQRGFGALENWTQTSGGIRRPLHTNTRK